MSTPPGETARPALRSTRGPEHTAILGLGAYRPSRDVPNADVVGAIDSSDEWIQQRSGIRSRRWAAEHETVQLMSVAAAREAVEAAGLEPADVDAVILATVTYAVQTPALAALVAAELGTGDAAAFDISAGCAAFCHGIGIASDLVRGGSARHVLVVGAERFSDFTDLTDRGTAFILADGAGAAVVGPSSAAGIGPMVWGADGTQADLIRSRQDWRDVVAGPDPVVPHLVMQGSQVFRWASFTMARTALEAIEAAGLTPDQLDCFVPHQANMRITDAMAKAMKLPATVRIARDIAEQGNTSAASIPLALHRMVADGDARTGDLALLIGFGAGLSWAAQVVRVP